MGGDHKCPVCEATFTRPQHVARHMRSRAYSCLCPTPTLTIVLDTGDRPYKMSILWRSICSEVRHSISLLQSPNFFCSSDLLSRHVNKCHANEKPLPTTGVRKKGSASASRATTSKQVCDQCVQANSSCDGSNPCGQFFSLLSFF